MKRWKLSRVAVVAIPVFAVVGFVTDLFTKKGFDDWIWYILALSLTLYVPRRRLPFWLAGFFSVLALIGFELSRPGVEPGVALSNDFMGIGVMWVMAGLIFLRKSGEARLRESEENFRSMFEVASIGMAQSEPDTGRLIRVNQKMCAITGYSSEELLGMRVLEITHPEDRERNWELFQRVVRGETSDYRIEKRYVRKDGRIAWVNVNMAVVRDAEGQPVRTMATIEDITERKEAEARIRKLSRAVEQSPASIIITDKCGKIEYVNGKFCEVTGYASEECVGKNPRILKSGEMSPEGYKELWSTITAGKEWRGELHNRKKNGELFWELAAISPIFDSAGKITHFLGVKEDITERKQLEAQFLRAQRLESVGALASGIAHDLNNILAPILLTAELLQSVAKDAEMRGWVDMIEDNAQRGADVLKQLLTFARGEPGARVPLLLRYLLNDAKKMIQETFPRDISPAMSADGDLWPILGDATQIHQVLLNLCVNARDAMPNGGTLTLRASNISMDEAAARKLPGARPGAYVCVAVDDTGVGIPAENLDRIFEPFFTTKELGKGTGLGLATVIGIVRGHGGFVRVISRLNKGTTFELYLPAEPQANCDPVLTGDCTPPRGEGELILVVDDEADVLDSVRDTLEDGGYRVITAARGAEAMKIFLDQRAHIRAILTDMMMPSTNGPELVQSVRAIDPGVPIIGMTGLPEQKGVRGIENLELEAMLMKPFVGDELLKVLRAALHPGSGVAANGGNG